MVSQRPPSPTNTPGPAEWGRGRLLGILVGVTVVAVVLIAGLAYAG